LGDEKRRVVGSEGIDGNPNEGRIATSQPNQGTVDRREDGRSPKGTPGIVYGAVSSSLL
jgi:hypothetical protein